MGTIFNQKPRKAFKVKSKDVVELLNQAQKISQEKGISLSDSLEVFRILEYRRRNDLYHWNGDTFDEQVAGLAKILDKNNQ